MVAKSTAGRDGSFVEVLGTYDPLAKPSTIKIKEDRALHWLMEGAQPTETVAYQLKKVGVLDKYFEARPSAKAKFKSLDKRTASMSRKSVVEVATPAPAPVASPEPTPAPVAEAPAEPVIEAPVEEVVAETPVVETPAEAPVAEATPEPEAPAEA